MFCVLGLVRSIYKKYKPEEAQDFCKNEGGC